MNEYMYELYIAFNLTAIFLGMISIAGLIKVRDIESRTRLFYTALFGFLIVWSAVHLGRLLLFDNGKIIAAGYLDCAIDVFSGLFVPMLTMYVLFLCGENLRGHLLMIIESALCLAHIVMVFAFHDPNDIPKRTGSVSTYLSLAVFLAMNITLAVFLFLRRKKMKKSTIILLLISMFASTFLQTLIFELFLIMEMSERYFHQKEENLRQQEELARQRVNLSVLQMRPHFIYNTMMSIYYLCEQDPKKGQQVTLDFTQYLRSNFNAVVQEGTVPFSEELEHTRAYLAVEQARYAELLSVTFDTPVTLFKLPPLTIQPIVENAIKHAMRENEMLRVTLTTAEHPDGFTVTVEDNGPGFTSTDDEPHIALDNIRERLQLSCGGTLTIEPREGGGTKVTVFVPRISVI